MGGLSPTISATVVSILLSFVSEARLNPNRAISVQLASKVPGGFGKGELQGYQANLRAITGLIVTLVYSRVFDIGIKRKFPGLFWLVVASIGAVTELLSRS